MRKRVTKILLCCFHIFCACGKGREMRCGGCEVKGSILRAEQQGHPMVPQDKTDQGAGASCEEDQEDMQVLSSCPPR